MKEQNTVQQGAPQGKGEEASKELLMGREGKGQRKGKGKASPVE